MALSFSEKTARMLRLLLGVRYPKVLGVLRRHGFTPADLEEGWALLRALGAADFAQPAEPDERPDELRELDAWENYWYPVIHATLERHYPDIAEEVFLNLPRTSGLEVWIAVDVLVGRIRKLEQGARGSASAAARRLLAKRGLTDQVVAEAERLVQSALVLGKPRPQTPHASTLTPELDAMWAWYREWSQLLRLDLDDGRLLRGLGLTSTRRS